MSSSSINYLRIAAHLAKTSVLAQMQYRMDFLLQMFMAFFWVFWNVAPTALIFDLRPEIASFRFEEAMLVVSAFLVLKALLDGLVQPNLLSVVQHIRNGTFDFVLLKPADTQLLVSTARIVPSKLVDLSCGIAIGVWSLLKIDPRPSVGEMFFGFVMLLSGAATLYALWLIVICTAFWFVRVDNLSFLFGSIFDAARWPITVFRGWVRVVLTFVLPVAVMTSYPALAALGRLDLETGLLSAAIALFFLLLSRRVWLWAVQHYASASS